MKRNFRRPAIVTALLALTLCLQGCESMAVRTFKPADASGQAPGNIKLHLYHSGASVPESTAFLNQATARTYPQLNDVLARRCQAALATPKPDKGLAGISLAAVTAIAPAVGKLAFDLYMEKQARNVDKLKKSLRAPYGAELTLDARQLHEAVEQGACLVLERSHADDKTPEFISVLALRNAQPPQRADKRRGPKPGGPVLQNYSSPNAQTNSARMAAFTATPVFIAARSAVAKTESAAQPTISVSLAVSARGIGRQDNGLPAFAPIGEAVHTVMHLPLGEPAPNSDTAKCHATACPTFSPIPLLPSSIDPQIVVIGVAVTETGNAGGVDLDIAQSELAATKAAIGPVISGAIEKALKE